MFRIRPILESSTPANRAIIAQVQDLIREQFSAIKEEEIVSLPEKLNDPLKYRFQSRLFVAEKSNGPVLGFALLLHVPDVGFSYLDFMATAKKSMGGGLGGALYARIREEAKNLKSKALLFECLPDDPRLSPNENIRLENCKRLAFYEKYQAYPIEGSLYETPLSDKDTDPPYMVVDLLGNDFPDGAFFKKAIRAILERKYAHLCPKEYIEKVVDSFGNKNLKLRAPHYQKKIAAESLAIAEQQKIFYLANTEHDIHHVKERGYVESPVRVSAITKELQKLNFMEKKEARPYPDRFLASVHDPDYLSYLKKACLSLPDHKSTYPYVFPIRNASRKPAEMAVLAGYYCIDTFTPLNANAYKAARSAVDCVLTASDFILAGQKVAYALVRPPGHHAERKTFGGFCYFANNAIAAEHLSQYGRVAILDIDYHHGNSQQDIFYSRSDVLTVSIHGHPKFAYPYFSGFEDEAGEGEGYGYNVNMPLAEHIAIDDYHAKIVKALKRIKEFSPTFFVVALGLDTAKADPTGTWTLKAEDFKAIGARIGELNLPTLVVQEGGYRTQTLGINARAFFTGVNETAFLAKPIKESKTMKRINSVRVEPFIRHNVRLNDIKEIRELVRGTGVFNDEEVIVAGELVADNVSKGNERSGYYFSIMEQDGKVIGYACYGPIPFTESVYDLYWIAVHADHQKHQYAKRLLDDAEEVIKKNKGDTIYAETSSRSPYEKARKFYLKNEFTQCSEYPNFYKKGDSKIVFVKKI